MELLTQLEQQLGLMAWPLFVCSALGTMIITERLFQVLLSLGVGKGAIGSALNQISPTNTAQIEALASEFSSKRPLLYKGVAMLLAHHDFAKGLREDAAGIWLQEKRHQLHSGLRILSLIGVISPLLGLLGTVLGLIEMFKGVALSSGNITPNDLADGLGIAMRTTAAGLLIALPAITGAQLLGVWADRVMAKLEHTLNYVNLWLEGVSLQHDCTTKQERVAKYEDVSDNDVVIHHD
ncbi:MULTISPECIES: MotA/TolQ/ExbB proton channel family protein [unclassified Vibrio]|uniref:MotA/TolQ/ExbB proton channel family protein n=1 Tax=unclassified Vibrio TaxID=2614977 RepID=UPI000B8ED7EF|nr:MULTISPECIES: MotA/TolQ/ExbB proton channel family protein [unclassified Vibrio]NAW91523.1 MotA/TolQ/ExbB proton channel family protein [Vibrio sp. V24_P1S3T111]OXX20281.1 biopolymer transporter ExbB [Vibrio sp. V05_P4A8T149]OXX27746.1 biopolymer transporter ExbB [Vibrio sp. V06_P1A73T115]OXX29985.1 biopolymer transporter ExbB [Vibrio sp. V04_P4A5T148]OXX30687.1 biopolymer transporter ExbB [Vibrio sp. V14_P6S14T42]